MIGLKTAKDETAAGAGAPVQLALLSDGKRDLAVRLAVALWFFVPAVNFVRDIAATLMLGRPWDLDMAAAARLIAHLCLLCFYLLVAWVALVRARPKARAPGLQPRIAAVLGAYLLFLMPLLPERHDLGVFWSLLSAALLAVGNVFTLIIVLRLGRSFSIMAEARRLVVDGPYAVIRHPLYLAEQVALLGLFIQYASPLAALLIGLQFAFQIQRMRNEEAVLLDTFPDYGPYMARTARLIPGVW